jgi:predicted nucleic acid-binding protein
VWPLLFEAVYLLGDLPQAQEALWEMLARGAVRLLTLDLIDIPRMRELMIKYADRPMDVADAALVRVAEREGIRRIFTVDQRFHGLSPSRTDRPCNRPIGELRNNTDPLKSPPTDRRLRE